MGDYTRIRFHATLRPDLPEEARRILREVVGKYSGDYGPLPDHAFFRTPSWDSVFKGVSAYIDTPEPAEFLEGEPTVLRFHRSLKDYDDEIRQFCAWIAPYVADPPGTVLGETEYSDAHAPTLLVLTKEQRISELLPQAEEYDDEGPGL
jgi:hypothetical protein